MVTAGTSGPTVDPRAIGGPATGRDHVVCSRVTQELDCDPASVTTGRHFASGALTSWGMSPGVPDHHARADILLVTTELLSNAVKAASKPILLSLEGHRNRVDISVIDDNPDPAVRLPAGIDSPGGRGLLIIDRIADDWGQNARGDGTKEVWAQLAVPAHAALIVDCRHSRL